MAYCKSCGAYIPDGQTKCLAWGYGEEPGHKEQPNNSGSAFAYRDQNAELKERLERQREAQKEAQRRLAEQEYARRRQQEQSRQWAEKEFARRQAEKEEQERRAAENLNRTRPAESAYSTGRYTQSASGNKILAALSYLGILCLLPFFLTENDAFARFRAQHGLRLLLFGLAGTVIGSIIGLGWLVTVANFYFIYKGMSNAMNGRMEPLPWIGTIGK